MNLQIEPVLEKFVKDDEIKEIAETSPVLSTAQQEQLNQKKADEEEQKKIAEKKKSEKNETKEDRYNDKMKAEGQLNIEGKRESSFFSASTVFLKPFDVIEEPNFKPKEIDKKNGDDLSLNKNIITKEETSELENVQSIFGYKPEEDKDPVKKSLEKRLQELEKRKEEIKRQHAYDKEVYLKRIEILENACNAKVDENKLKKLENRNKINKDLIKEYKLKIESAEKEKIKDRQRFNDVFEKVLKLKAELIYEINQLEILTQKTSFEDYEQYMLDNPTKIDKINFRPNDSRYLLTNEYETSRDEEESLSSYEKLNNINKTPDVFDFNRQNLFMNKTVVNNNMNFNNKNNKIHIGINEDNNINDKINIYIQSKTFNKDLNDINLNRGTEGNIFLKQKEIKEPKIIKNINIIQPQTDLNNTNNIKKMSDVEQNIKRFYPKDPDFINNDMILIRNEEDRDSDTFY